MKLLPKPHNGFVKIMKKKEVNYEKNNMDIIYFDNLFNLLSKRASMWGK